MVSKIDKETLKNLEWQFMLENELSKQVVSLRIETYFEEQIKVVSD